MPYPTVTNQTFPSTHVSSNPEPLTDYLKWLRIGLLCLYACDLLYLRLLRKNRNDGDKIEQTATTVPASGTGETLLSIT